MYQIILASASDFSYMVKNIGLKNGATLLKPCAPGTLRGCDHLFSRLPEQKKSRLGFRTRTQFHSVTLDFKMMSH